MLDLLCVLFPRRCGQLRFVFRDGAWGTFFGIVIIGGILIPAFITRWIMSLCSFLFGSLWQKFFTTPRSGHVRAFLRQ